ncbi:MAG: ABC transporter substrate-binding protein [Fibrobacterota bacterium]
MDPRIRKTLAVFILLPALLYPAAIGILIEKSGEMTEAPVRGIKSVAGADVAEFNMEGNAATGKKQCQSIKSGGAKVCVVVGKNAAKIAMAELPGMPIVYCMVMNPEEDGIRGVNITGVSLDVPMNKQFDAFKSVVPKLKKVGLVYSGETSASLVAEMKKASVKAGLTLVEKKVAGDAEVPNAVREMKGSIDGLYLPPDKVVAQRDAFQFIALFTFENNLPFMAPSGRFVSKGALVALMIDYEDVGKQAGDLARKIAAGASPSSLPPEPPRATILVLNQKTAQTIGINIPPHLLESSQVVK